MEIVVILRCAAHSPGIAAAVLSFFENYLHVACIVIEPYAVKGNSLTASARGALALVHDRFAAMTGASDTARFLSGHVPLATYEYPRADRPE